MKKIVMVIMTFLLSLPVIGQEKIENVNKIFHSKTPSVRTEIVIPQIDGFNVYKCDFHIHTMFSDGVVWPAYRVNEGWLDGLDVMAITDHIEYRPNAKYLKANLNTSYDIALEEAKKHPMLLIRGTEITRQQGVIGHFNALFTKDNTTIPNDDPKKAIQNALDQGAFILFNHPGWVVDTVKLSDFQKDVLDSKMIHGIEVINNHEYYPRVLSWCVDWGYTVFANSDLHRIASEDYVPHRPMTLVMATDLSENSIREALDKGRTLAYWENKVAGRASLLEDLFCACVRFEKYATKGKETLCTITNRSSLHFSFEVNGKLYELPGMTTITCALDNLSFKVKVLNMWSYEDRHPEFEMTAL